jgi:hypothetical protein
MALVDFCQLVDLYKLHRADAGFLSTHPHPLSMPATTPPLSPSPSVEPDEVHLPPPPPVQFEFKTPERRSGAVRPVLGVTPVSNGASVRQRQEGDTDQINKYDRDDYESYIREDLRNRVFVDFEVFMKAVLHVPVDWKIRWKPAIDAVKANQKFRRYHKVYCEHCENEYSLEKPFYEPLMYSANAILDVLTQSTFEDISSGIPQRYHVKSTDRLQGGVINKRGLSPDLVSLHAECKPSEAQPLHWANPLHVLEVKPFDNSLCDGTNMPRLVVDGEHPTLFFRIRSLLICMYGEQV